ncbi:transcriptional regulator, Cro/CI family protein [Carnobacterium sp. AT7]|uniref:helix-turn-helix domain-containing protein n=1 Tax=Carnobacterium sp. AT7 TaxID=333990 RepID=UPI00015F10CE|nr:helix-turn-helix transcriptional regulator [Carnobacterium sp. AT7]EDP68452.1 transcriptional regulator, Cro/CI family protein [Carnobacterium sp. AT7]
MGLYEKIKLLAKERKISIRKLEEDLDYGNGTIRRWEENSPGIDKVEKVADYFGVTTDYLLGREPKETSPVDLNEILDNTMSFDGKPMNDHDREAIRAYLEGRFSNK